MIPSAPPAIGCSPRGVSMRNLILAAAAALFITSLYSGARVSAQGAAQPPGPPPAGQPPAGQPPAGQPPPGGQGGGRGRAGQGFPPQQRPPAPAPLIERGNTLYGINCRLCHGAD